MSVRSAVISTAVLCFAIVLGCSNRPSRILPAIDRRFGRRREKRVEQYGKDGVIAGEDLNKCAALKAALAQIDTAGDKTITAEKNHRSHQGVGRTPSSARMSVSCTILRKRPTARRRRREVRPPKNSWAKTSRKPPARPTRTASPMIRHSDDRPQGSAGRRTGLLSR